MIVSEGADLDGIGQVNPDSFFKGCTALGTGQGSTTSDELQAKIDAAKAAGKKVMQQAVSQTQTKYWACPAGFNILEMIAMTSTLPSIIAAAAKADIEPPGRTGCKRLGYECGLLQKVNPAVVEAAKKEGLEIIKRTVGHCGTPGSKSYYTKHAVWACPPLQPVPVPAPAPAPTPMLAPVSAGLDWKMYALIGAGVIAVGIGAYLLLRK